jgi:hypothetical protein
MLENPADHISVIAITSFCTATEIGDKLSRAGEGLRASGHSARFFYAIAATSRPPRLRFNKIH